MTIYFCEVCEQTFIYLPLYTEISDRLSTVNMGGADIFCQSYRYVFCMLVIQYLLLIFIQNVDRAGKAQQTGAFNKEITPVTTKVTDKDGNEHTVTVCDI